MKKDSLEIVLKAIIFAFLIVCISTSAQVTVASNQIGIDQQVGEIVDELTVREKIGQLFMVYWTGKDLTNGLERLITEYKVGSIYISVQNFDNIADTTAAYQVANLTRELQLFNWNQNYEHKDSDFLLPLFLVTDHEGDSPLYTRIRSGMTPLPSQLAIGATFNKQDAEEIGEIVGRELDAIGINMVLGPVLDVLDDPDRGEQGNLDVRVFGGEPMWVGELGRSYISGIHSGSEGRVLTVAKHFPGHGDSDRGADRAVAITTKDVDDLLEVDLVPFLRVTELDEDNPEGTTDAIMSSHIAIKDTGLKPISMAPNGLLDLFEGDFGFNDWYSNGFIVSDSLGVPAIKNIYPGFPHRTIAMDAFLAGNDLLILHNFYETSSETDVDVHARMRDVIDYFVDRYYDDERVRERVDEAVVKIVRAKITQYPEMSIESIIVDPEVVENKAGIDEHYQVVNGIAEQAIALLKPSNVDQLPAPPTKNENIVFLFHNINVPRCDECGYRWINSVEKNFVDFMIDDRDYPSNRIESYYFYRTEESDPPGVMEYLGSWYGEDYSDYNDEKWLIFENILNTADWIISISVTGDCGPFSYKINLGDARCNEGRPEAETLWRLLEYKKDLIEEFERPFDAKIVAIVFGAPPWNLTTTSLGYLDVYYGAFSQIEPFQQQAVKAMLGEFEPTGASPIDIPDLYDVHDATLPDLDQEVDLDVVNEPIPSTWNIGDELNIQTSIVLDYNGNPVVDGTRVQLIGKLANGVIFYPLSEDILTTDGQTEAMIELSRSGSIIFTARIGELESNPLPIEVQSQPQHETAETVQPITINVTTPALIITTEKEILTPLAVSTTPTKSEEITTGSNLSTLVTLEPIGTPEPPGGGEGNPTSVELWVALILGSIFIMIILIFAIIISLRTSQSPIPPIAVWIFRVVLSIAAAGFASVIPGFLSIRGDLLDIAVRASGAIAVFLIVYKFNPPVLVEGFVGGSQKDDEDQNEVVQVEGSLSDTENDKSEIEDTDVDFGEGINNHSSVTGSSSNGGGMVRENELRKLRDMIDRRFSLDDVQNLCFDLGVSYENLNGNNKLAKIRSLIEHFNNREELSILVERCRILRPLADWPPV